MFQFEDITGLENAFQLVLKHSPASGSTNSKYRLVTPVIIRNSMWYYYYRGTKIVLYPKLRYYYVCCRTSCETNARIQAGQDILSCLWFQSLNSIHLKIDTGIALKLLWNCWIIVHDRLLRSRPSIFSLSVQKLLVSKTWTVHFGPKPLTLIPSDRSAQSLRTVHIYPRPSILDWTQNSNVVSIYQLNSAKWH